MRTDRKLLLFFSNYERRTIAIFAHINERKNNVWNTKCGADLENYSNFCNQSGWKTDLEQLKASTANEAIYIVKDYGNVNNTEKTNPCWQLYDSKQLKSDMGDNSSDPVLPFTCFTQRKYEWS